jgi:RNA polymerase sigma-70 factor, ECF subfamily
MALAVALGLDVGPREGAVKDDARLRSIVLEHYDFVWRSLRRLGVAESQVDDAAQQVLLVLARKLTDVHEGAERSFLFGTAVRVASDHRKKVARRREVGDPSALELEPSDVPSAEELLDQRRARAMLDHVLDEMPEDLRHVLILAELEGMKMHEMADLLHLPQGTVASRLRRARALFEQLVAGRVQPEVSP